MPKVEPKIVIVEDVQYDYTRLVAEILTCLTCKSVFFTHVTTGRGAFFIEDDKEMEDVCAGCKEMLASQDITEQDGVKPS